MPRGTHPNSLKNLKKGNKPTQFKRGEKRSAESIERQKQTCREKRTMKELLEKRLNAIYKVTDGEEITAKDAIMEKIIKNAIKTGDINTIKFIRETIGEQPQQNFNTDKLDIVLNEIEGNI